MAIEITPTGTNLQIALDEKFGEILNTEDNGTYRLEQAFIQDELPFGKTLYARVRHNAEETGYSKWSKVVTFHVEIPAMIIGVAVDLTQSPATVNYIDMDGNKFENPDLANHAAFKNITMVTMDSARAPVTMTKFPKFYIKTSATGIPGTFSEGKLCYWISDLPFEGFRVHPAFKRMNEQDEESGKYKTNDYVYIGTYVGHYESASGSGGVLGSKVNQSVATGSSSYTRSNLINYCKARNNTSAGESGWHAYDIWDVSLLQWLGLFWKGTFNFQSAYGTNSSSSPRTGATQARLVFKGTQSSPEVWVDDVWSCYWQHVDLISHSSGRISLISPMNGSSSISIGGSSSDYTMATSSGYVKTFCSAPFVLGDDSHDLLELFLPKTVVGSESSSLAPDYYNYNTETSYLKVGGYWSNSSQGGLFSLHSLGDTYQESYQSYEVIRYETIPAGWPSSRRCGCIFMSCKDSYFDDGWIYREAESNGESTWNIWPNYEKRCNCSVRYGPADDGGRWVNWYVAICAIDRSSGTPTWEVGSADNWLATNSNTCPRGWGKLKYRYPNDNYSVQCAQGYVGKSYQNPVYGYVTRYRTAYYNYIATRVSKA